MSEWQPIETAPALKDLLVSVTYNGPDGEWETVMWVDCKGVNEKDEEVWLVFPRLIHVPFFPTHWMHLPEPPEND